MPDKSFPAARNLVAEGGVVVSRTDDEAKVRDSVYWSNCKPAKGSPHLEHAELRERLWTVTEDVLTRAQRAIMT